MVNERTSEQAKAHYEDAMGKPLGSVFHALWQEIALLHIRWQEYVSLFGTSASRVDLLNRAAPTFFRRIQDVLWEDTVLGIARLTDPEKTGRKENLTIRQLTSLIGDPALSQQVKELVDDAIAATKFCKDWRNRHLAHRDLHLLLGKSAKPLELGRRDKVRNAMSAIVAALNAVQSHYTGSTSMFDVGPEPGGAETLLHRLDEGLRYDEERRDRLDRGELRPHGYANRNI